MSLTLAEIRVEVPKLQTSIEGSKIAMKRFTDELGKIATQMKAFETLTKDDEEELARYEKFLLENESSTVPEIVARVNDYKTRKADIEKAMKDREKEVAELEKDKKAVEEDPAYQQMQKDVAEARTKLDSIYATLEKDPIINEKLQEAIRFEYYTEIQKQKDEKAKLEGLGSKLEAGIKDDSKDGLKKLVDATVTRRETYLKGMYDDKIDVNAARTSLKSSIVALSNQIKVKYGVEIKSQQDINYILDFASGKVTGEFKLPSAEKQIEKADRIVAKLEQKRDAKIAELQGKAVAPASPENTAEIEENQRVIEELQKQNAEDLDPEIAEATQKIDEIDAKIDEKTKETPEDKQALEDAEQELKDNHIVSPEVLTDLKDETSDLSKLFQEFVAADKELREALRKNELDETDEAKDGLDDVLQAIIKYKGIAEQLANESGYDIESWQNYNKELLNEKVANGETIDDVYTYRDKRNFFKLADDKNVRKSSLATSAYNAAYDELDELDKNEDLLLNGHFNVAPKIKKSLEDFHDIVDNLQTHAGPGVNVYGVMRGSSITKVSMWTKFKNFVGKHFKDKPYFPVPDGKELVDAYLSKKPGASLSQEEKEEIENLRKEKDELVAGRKVLQDKKAENETTISDLETKNADLAARDSARTTSELGTEEERRFVTQMGISKSYVDGTSVKEDIKKVIDDDGR